VVTDPLEAELDQLFQLPSAAIVEARNALADRLKKAGDKAAAARVKALKRPTPAAWAINQLFFRDAELLESARAQTLRLRELQARDGVEPRALSAAVEAQRAALQAAVEAALRVCEEAGAGTAAPQQRKIFTTLQAWLAGTGDEAPGRMTHDIEPSGFDALGAVGEAAPRPLPAVPPPKTAGPAQPQAASDPPPRAAGSAPTPGSKARAPDPKEQELKLAAAKLAELEQRAEAAREQAQRRRSEQDSSRLAFERAQSELNAAERTLSELRAKLVERERDLGRRHASLDEAEQAQQHADAAAARARTELAAIRKRHA
jgi:hypothetical protein